MSEVCSGQSDLAAGGACRHGYRSPHWIEPDETIRNLQQRLHDAEAERDTAVAIVRRNGGWDTAFDDLLARKAAETALTAAHARITALEEALGRYGADHDADCPAVTPIDNEKLDRDYPEYEAKIAYLDSLINGCTCGFAALLSPAPADAAGGLEA